MKKKLLIINGAGASIDFGFPSVDKIDELFEEWSLKILPLDNNPNESLYTWMKQEIIAYNHLNPRNKNNHPLNFEKMFFVMLNIAAILDDVKWKNFSYPLNSFISFNKMFPDVVWYERIKHTEGYDFSFLQTHLVDELLDHFRGKCKSLLIDKKNNVEKLKQFYNSLKNDFELGFINLNYDNVITTAIPELFTGFNHETGELDKEQIYSNKWNFCYHLHGSVHFDFKESDGTIFNEIFWNNDLNSNFRRNSGVSHSDITKEGLWHLSSPIIAGLDKTNQLLKEPFVSYFMQLGRLIYEADSILFVGYGFGDSYLNKIFYPFRFDHQKKKVVIIDLASDDEDGLNFRRDNWSNSVFQTIPFNGFEMGIENTRIPHPVAYYKHHKSLEKSSNSNYPLAVWYDGIMKACKYPDTILKELI
jgi:hypothetical protein